MAKIDVIGTAENGIALALVVGLAVVLYYVAKGVSTGTTTASNAIGAGIDKANAFLANPLATLFPGNQGNAAAPAKPITDLTNVNENGALVLPPDYSQFGALAPAKQTLDSAYQAAGIPLAGSYTIPGMAGAADEAAAENAGTPGTPADYQIGISN
jgi:hypothetical protein